MCWLEIGNKKTDSKSEKIHNTLQTGAKEKQHTSRRINLFENHAGTVFPDGPIRRQTDQRDHSERQIYHQNLYYNLGTITISIT